MVFSRIDVEFLNFSGDNEIIFVASLFCSHTNNNKDLHFGIFYALAV